MSSSFDAMPMRAREPDLAWDDAAGARASPAALPRARPRRASMFYIVGPAGDLASGATAFVLAVLLRYHVAPALNPWLAIAPPPARLYTAAFWVYLVLLVAILGLGGAYRRPLAWTGSALHRAVVPGVTFAVLALLLATFLFDPADKLSRGWLVATWVLTCILATGVRQLARWLARRLAAAGLVGHRVLIVGTHPEALTMEWLLRRQRELGLQVVGFVDDAVRAGTVVQAGKAVVGGTADLRALISAHGADVVLISARASSHAQVLTAVEATLGTPAEIVMSPDVFAMLTTGAAIVSLPGLPVVKLSKLRLGWGERLVKEVFDRLGALLLLLLLSPLLLILAVIAWRSAGGIVERHTALGIGGTSFEALKFRTRRVDGAATPENPDITRRRLRGLPVRDDPGLTRCGRVLRRTSLDELPQLWNVLRGQMSLVGPYKIAPQDLHHYGPRWLSVVTLKPGITGMAQVHGRGELTIEERSILDAEYVRDYSLWRDVVLLLATTPAALRGRGAY